MAKKPREINIRLPWVKDGPSDEDLIEFFQEMSWSHSSGLKFTECLNEYAATCDRVEMMKLMKPLKGEFQKGYGMSDSLEHMHGKIPQYAIEFLRIGEEISNIDLFLEKICERMDAAIQVKDRIATATRIPKISFIFLFVVALFAIYVMIPKLGDVFKEVGVELPAVTQMVIKMGDILATFWFIIPLIVAGIIYGYRYYKKNYPVEYSLIMLRVPFYKDVAYYNIQYNFCSIYGICMDNAVESKRALEFTAMALENEYLKGTIRKAVSLMKSHGMSVADALKRADKEHILAHKVIQRVDLGQRTGNTGDIMLRTANNYKRRFDMSTQKFSDSISSAVLVPSYIMFILVIGMIMYPMMGLTQSISQVGRSFGM